MIALLYQDAIKDLAHRAHGHGHIDGANYSTRLDNPLCGDRIDLEIKIAGDRIGALGHITRGCLLCRAAASLLGLRATGQSIADLQIFDIALRQMLQDDGPAPPGWPEVTAFLPVRGYASRHACVLLPFDALRVLSERASTRICARKERKEQ